jgi:Bacteriophage baseplate protein W
MAELFVGRGIAFPMRVNATGGLALVSSDEEIIESIRLILGTSPG